MILALGVAGVSSAHDGTKVIYDLSELGTRDLEPISEAAVDHEMGTPQGSALPRSGSPDFWIEWSGGNFELVRRHRGGATPNNPTAYAPPRNGGTINPATATPNPEPGTLVLLGSGLAAGARFVRRRKTV
jgi:hypothetical protein